MAIRISAPRLSASINRSTTRNSTLALFARHTTLARRLPLIMDMNQARGESTTGLSEWKKRAPYRIHGPNEQFQTRYEANCHCGRVKYQLSRQKPLDSKLCHCTTCQTQHGQYRYISSNRMIVDALISSCAIPVGCYLLQGGTFVISHPGHVRKLITQDINFSYGHHDLEWYNPTGKSIEHKLPCKVRCSYCHSPIMDEGRNMILLFPSLIHLKTDEDKAFFKPRSVSLL
jgi:hypothetical protein